MGRISQMFRSAIARATPIQCAGCGHLHQPGDKFISGPDVYICATCNGYASTRFNSNPPDVLSCQCSFCGKIASTVPLEAEGHHAICYDCVGLVNVILSEREVRSLH